MAFKDLDELLGSPPKELPIRGKMHRFPDRISAESGMVLLRITQAVRADPKAAEDGDALVSSLLPPEGWEALQTEILGKPAEEFIAEGLTGDEVMHVFKTLTAWHVHGQDSAEAAWNSLGNPSAPNREARRAKTAKSNPGRGSRGGSKAAKPKAATPGPSSSTGGR